MSKLDQIREDVRLQRLPDTELVYAHGPTILALLDVIKAAESLAMIHRANRMAGLPTPALEAFDAALALLEGEGR